MPKQHPDTHDVIVIAKRVMHDWVEEKKEKDRQVEDLDFEESQRRIKEKTRKNLDEQARLHRELNILGGELAALEKLCRREHRGKGCPDCSWEPW